MWRPASLSGLCFSLVAGGFVGLMSALLFAVRCLFAAFRRCLSSHVCLALRSVRVCVAFQLRVDVAVLLELTELAKPVERPCLCCNTRSRKGVFLGCSGRFANIYRSTVPTRLRGGLMLRLPSTAGRPALLRIRFRAGPAGARSMHAKVPKWACFVGMTRHLSNCYKQLLQRWEATRACGLRSARPCRPTASAQSSRQALHRAAPARGQHPGWDTTP